MKKLLSLVLCALMAISLMAGCAQSSPSAQPSAAPAPAPSSAAPQATPQESAPAESGKPYEGTTLRIIDGGQPCVQITILEHLAEFEEKTGIKVEYETLASDAQRNKQAVELAAQSSSIDIVTTAPLNEIKQFVRNGWLIPIEDYFKDDADFDLQDYFPGALGTCSYEGVLYGIPLLAECQILYYRKDIFAENNLELPKTMDELYETAVKLTDTSKDFYGFVGRGKQNMLISQFATYLYSFGGTYNNATQSLINTPEAEAAIRFYGKLLHDAGPPGSINNSWPEAAAIFAQGQAAMFADSDAIYANVTDKDKSTVSDQVGFAMMPAGPAGQKPFSAVVLSYGISAFSENADASAEFIKWAGSKDIDVLMTQETKNPSCRSSTWDNPAAFEGWPEGMLDVMLATREVSVAGDRPTVINVSQARDIVSMPILEAIMGNDPSAAIEAAHKEFQELIDQENAELAKS